MIDLNVSTKVAEAVSAMQADQNTTGTVVGYFGRQISGAMTLFQLDASIGVAFFLEVAIVNFVLGQIGSLRPLRPVLWIGSIAIVAALFMPTYNLVVPLTQAILSRLFGGS